MRRVFEGDPSLAAGITQEGDFIKGFLPEEGAPAIMLKMATILVQQWVI